MSALPKQVYMVVAWYPLPSNIGDRCRLHVCGAFYSHKIAREEEEKLNAKKRESSFCRNPDGSLRNPCYVVKYKMRDASYAAEAISA